MFAFLFQILKAVLGYQAFQGTIFINSLLFYSLSYFCFFCWGIDFVFLFYFLQAIPHSPDFWQDLSWNIFANCHQREFNLNFSWQSSLNSANYNLLSSFILKTCPSPSFTYDWLVPCEKIQFGFVILEETNKSGWHSRINISNDKDNDDEFVIQSWPVSCIDMRQDQLKCSVSKQNQDALIHLS